MNATHWTEAEKTILREMWPSTAAIRTWKHLIPGKSKDAIISVARRMGLGKRPVSRKAPYKVNSWTCIEQLLSDGVFRSVPEIAKEAGFNASVIRKQLQDRIGQQVYVAEWRYEVNKYVAYFALGVNQYNARKPKAKPHAEHQRNSYARRKKFRPEAHEEHLRKRRLREAAKRPAPQTTDPAASWLNNNAEENYAAEANAVQEESAQEASLAQQDGAGRLPGASVFPVYSGSLLRGYGNGSTSASQ